MLESVDECVVGRRLRGVAEVAKRAPMTFGRVQHRLRDRAGAAVCAVVTGRERRDEQNPQPPVDARVFVARHRGDVIAPGASYDVRCGPFAGGRSSFGMAMSQHSQEPVSGSVRSSVKPVVEILSGPGRVSREAVEELWRFREVLWAFALRQVKVRYKQAVIGIGWSVLQPVAAALLFAVFLGRYAAVPSEGVPYLLFALAGMIVWTYFSNAAGTGSESLVANQSLLRKVYFPREVLPLATVGAALIDLAVGVCVLTVAAALYGFWPELTWVALPLPLLIVVVAAAAFAVGLSSVNVYYRDVRHALPFVLQVGLFVTPVVYPLSVLPEAWRDWYAVLNPVAGAVDGVRRIVLHDTWPDMAVTLGAFAWSTILLVAAYALFKRLERGFADRV